ncbi:MAG: FAD-binding oxidoreductase [Crocinitomicaceae bacterium]|nr:FAD-binding oxidoreductase [Crocinitomicaceae bacterium]|tara:strand:- start:2701 stop:4104 length:1404 start_codon:yes stop_codon:yes gene_type:complete
MSYNTITPSHIEELKTIVGKDYVYIDSETLENYAQDETEDLKFPPEVVLKPANAEEIARVLKLANTENIPVTPIGAKTGLSGGALSVYGGIGLSMERLNKILEIDEKNLQATVEPAVITQEFYNACKELGLYYPPDPSSWGSCFIGGNLAYNSGGPKAVKYGVTKDYVINLEVVLPNGEIIWTGANVLKNSTGYNLTQLMVGSEGTLGIITKAVFRLIPYPKHLLTMLVPFESPEKACEAVSAVFRAGLTPCAMEFMERDALNWTIPMVSDFNIEVPDHIGAHLIVEVDGNDLDVLYKECEQITNIMESFGADNVLFADDEAQKESIWKLRRRVGEAVKKHSIYKEEDTVVPRYEMPKLLKGVKEIGNKYGFQSVCYGHVGDGNLHVNIVKGEMSDHDWNHKLTDGIREIFHLTKSLGGTISGEHGIGYVQKQYLDIVFNEAEMAVQKGVKNLFDPNGILNPGKIFV